MKKIELLAPAGDMTCLKAAIMAGCDAVYLGGTLFGARAFAGNFTNEEIIEAINYAHLYGVKVYVTINTIIYENEVERFLDYVRFLHKNNVDAVIIQDIGMFDLLRKKFPNLELHASTQMHIHNYDGALLAKKLGFKRIVLARETPIDVIKKIKEEIDIEVEVFIHGALCVSYSGQCLMSALIGRRSGNRGTCAQICRKPYDLYDINNKKLNNEKYLLSTKDLCTLENLDKIINTGVDSLKIEGRMKRWEYVYLVTKIYRKAIDNYYATLKLSIKDEDIISLKKIFNREFTKGFILNEDNDKYTYEVRPNHKGVKIGTVLSKKHGYVNIKLTDELNVHDALRILDDKEDKGLVVNKMYVNKKSVLTAKKGDIVSIKYDKFVKDESDVLLTTSFKQIKEIENLFKNNKRKVLIDAEILLKVGKPLTLRVSDGQNEVILDSVIVEPSINKPISKEQVIKQLNKTNDTIYKFNKISVDISSNCFVNIKNINELRRKALKKLDEKRLYKIDFIENDYSIDVPDFKREEKLSVLTHDDDLDLNRYDIKYTYNKDTSKKDFIIKLPRVITKYENYNNKVLIGELGGINTFKNFDTDFSFNVVNSYSIAFLHSMGANCVTLSYELTLKQIENIITSYEKRYNKHPNVSVIINSYPECMISKFNLNKKYNVSESYLKDSYGNKLRVETKDDCMVIYYYEKINNYNENDLYKIGVNNIRINL